MKITIRNLVDNNLCTGCGLCTSESNGALKMEWNDDGFLIPVDNGNPFDNERAIKVCPFNPNPDDLVKDEDIIGSVCLPETTKHDYRIGGFVSTYVGYSEQFRRTSSSGGIATFMFKQLLSSKVVDYIYIVREVEGSYSYQLYSDFDRIELVSKTRYIPVTLEDLFKQIDNIDGKIAISGVACFIKAIRLKQYYNPSLYDKIPFLIGIICGGWKSKHYTDFLAQSAGINGNYSGQEYRVKDPNSLASDYSFSAKDDQGFVHSMKMSTVGDMWGTGLFKSRACDFCTDVVTELADISLGDAWLPEYRSDGLGNSIIVTRSQLSEKIIRDGMLSGELKVSAIAPDQIIKSQLPSFAHRQDAVKFRLRLSYIKGNLTPYVRNRVMKSISISYAIVQIQRERTRSKSLRYWKKCKDVKVFLGKIKRPLKVLRYFTLINHKLRNL